MEETSAMSLEEKSAMSWEVTGKIIEKNGIECGISINWIYNHR
jgi:hypothetical protein